MIKFLISLTGVTGAVLVAVLTGAWPAPSYFYQSLILLFTATTGLFYFLLNIQKSQPTFFVQLYLLTIAVKLLAYGTYLGVVIWKDPEMARQNVVLFMVVYVLYTVLEVGFLRQKVDR